eukprot:NODE_872_length_738_cov_567.624093_g669_i0.p1 GENE.NODE_872_length_738_cov_567.624093_g669_i0~~NODE_872_length_738_cov_567.624093_g669_i0.p1  ORF type:complete len:213 (+),score=40.56 NODE_872_length_738_cov_567.624093_g669_i0:22-639(+)
MGGISHIAKRMYSQALADFTESLHIKHTDYAMVTRARCHYLLGNRRKALSDFASAIKLENASTAYGVRAELHMSEDEIEEAISDFDKELELRPNNIRFRMLRGRSLLQNNQHERARKDLELCLKTEPNNVDCLIGTAAVNLRYGETNREEGELYMAIEKLEKAMKLSDNNENKQAAAVMLESARETLRQLEEEIEEPEEQTLPEL